MECGVCDCRRQRSGAVVEAVCWGLHGRRESLGQSGCRCAFMGCLNALLLGWMLCCLEQLFDHRYSPCRTRPPPRCINRLNPKTGSAFLDESQTPNQNLNLNLSHNSSTTTPISALQPQDSARPGHFDCSTFIHHHLRYPSIAPNENNGHFCIVSFLFAFSLLRLFNHLLVFFFGVRRSSFVLGQLSGNS
jgi:hypothetical protein